MSQTKISKEEKAYVAQCKVWLKTQQCAIDSCTLSIKQAKENIALAKQRIKLETAELKSKEATKAAVIKNMNAILSRKKK